MKTFAALLAGCCLLCGGQARSEVIDFSKVTCKQFFDTHKGDVSLKEGLGSQLLVHFSIDAPRAQTEDVRAAVEEQLSASEVTSVGEGIALVDARVPITTGERACFAVDTERLHFFDPATGVAVSV